MTSLSWHRYRDRIEPLRTWQDVARETVETVGSLITALMLMGPFIWPLWMACK